MGQFFFVVPFQHVVYGCGQKANKNKDRDDFSFNIGQVVGDINFFNSEFILWVYES